MRPGIEVPTRSRAHRLMLIGYAVAGVMVLSSLMFPVGPAPAVSATLDVAEAQTQIASLPADAGQTDRLSTVLRSEDVPATVPVAGNETKLTEVSQTAASAITPTEVVSTPAESIEPPASLSETQLLASLQETAVELDLYTQPDKRRESHREYAKEVFLKRKRALESMHELQKQLAQPMRLNSGSEALLDAIPGAAEEMEQKREDYRDRLRQELTAARQYEPLKQWLKERPDLVGLPLAMDANCRLSDDRARELARVSNEFLLFRRAQIQELRRTVRSPTAVQLDAAFDRQVETDPESFLQTLQAKFGYAETVPGLVQVMQGRSELFRQLAVQTLSGVGSVEASVAIASRAVFDPSPVVRQTSIEALKQRDRSEFRPVLLNAFRYVWPPAAQHAAETIVAVNDQAARSDLLDLSGKPDPRAPRQSKSGSWSVHELSRVNHLRNCLLCHAPVVEPDARPTGNVPSPSERLPVAYYEGSTLAAVRADVTYLRQDFSAVQEVENPGPWPKQQRFDYFVRKRELAPRETNELVRRYSDREYPQRQSVLYALQQLDALRDDQAIAARD